MFKNRRWSTRKTQTSDFYVVVGICMTHDYGNINITRATTMLLRCSQLTAVPTTSGVQEDSREEYDDLAVDKRHKPQSQKL
jgi:hypothetical protein